MLTAQASCLTGCDLFLYYTSLTSTTSTTSLTPHTPLTSLTHLSYNNEPITARARYQDTGPSKKLAIFLSLSADVYSQQSILGCGGFLKAAYFSFFLLSVGHFKCTKISKENSHLIFRDFYILPLEIVIIYFF